MIVEELRAVVAIKPSQGKRQGCLDIFDLLYYSRFSFAPDSSLFCPASGDIHTVEGKGKHARHRCVAMSNSVSLQKPWPTLIPLVSLYRYLFPQECSGFCGGHTTPFVLNPDRFQYPVDG